MRQTVSIDGGTTITMPGLPPIEYAGGLFALASNRGVYTRGRFTVIPQFGMELGYQWTRNLKFYLGYNFVLWCDVLRAGDQIDLTLNPTQIPPGQLLGPARPSFTFRDSDFWAQGLNFGVELRF